MAIHPTEVNVHVALNVCDYLSNSILHILVAHSNLCQVVVAEGKVMPQTGGVWGELKGLPIGSGGGGGGGGGGGERREGGYEEWECE